MTGTVLAAPGSGSWKNTLDSLRSENTGAVLLLVAAVAGMVSANTIASGWYHGISETVVGPAALHLDLTIAQWATDGLLAIFFFVVGLELKRELVEGDLRHPARAVVPVVAAAGGVAVPAVIYSLVNNLHSDGVPSGWAVPTATDIAFAVAVFSLCGRGLPVALRAFLLTLAVVDDLVGIVIIAVVFSDGLALGWLAVVAVAAVAFRSAHRIRCPPWWVLFPVATVVWAAMHASGVHATIAGCLLGFLVPVRPRVGEAVGFAERYELRWRPVSALVAAPVFAFFAVGVTFGDGALAAAWGSPVTWGVIIGLVLGKPIGITLATLALVKFSRAQLDDRVRWPDIAAVGAVGGVGFTVALLMSELSFDETIDLARTGVLAGSVLAACLGGTFLLFRSRWHRRHGGADAPPATQQ